MLLKILVLEALNSLDIPERRNGSIQYGFDNYFPSPTSFCSMELPSEVERKASSHISTNPRPRNIKPHIHLRRTSTHRYLSDNKQHSFILNKNKQESNYHYLFDKVVDYGTCDQKHPNSQLGETLYRVQWYSFQPHKNTWDPISHIP